MTPLSHGLVRRIAASGPMTVADFMAECLLHPEHGYYTTRDPLGASGDFTTAPEISQMFGELLGLCLAQAWQDQGAPARFALTELGPGRGTLMSDLLRATRRVKGFHEAAEIHLVEVSPALRARQRAVLSDHVVQWHADVTGLPDDLPLFLVANEFFDALPVRQFLRDGDGDGWRERVVTLRDTGLAFALAPPSRPGFMDHRLADTRAGDLVEARPAAGPIIAPIASRIGARGGAAIIIDYGGAHSLGDTLQAVRDHRPEDVLANPGAADLTAHVDFGALCDAAEGVTCTGLTPQGLLLERLGIAARAQVLARKLQGPALESHIAAHRRLTHPDEMGTLFQALALHAPQAPPPPGFNVRKEP